jgi:hypothetical protein
MMAVAPMESAMRYRILLLVSGLLCTTAVAQQVSPPVGQASDRWGPLPASTATTGAYRDTLSTAATEAQRFNFSDQPGKDKAPPDQTPIRVIINRGYGPHVNCVPMGIGGACH